MKPILVVNIHELKGMPFLCAHLYDGRYLVVQIIAPANEQPLVKKLREVVWANCEGLPAFDVWTNTESIYVACLGEGDISAQFKTLKDTEETIKGIENEKVQEALADMYQLDKPKELEQQKQTEQLSKWRTWLINLLRKSIKLLQRG